MSRISAAARRSFRYLIPMAALAAPIIAARAGADVAGTALSAEARVEAAASSGVEGAREVGWERAGIFFSFLCSVVAFVVAARRTFRVAPEGLFKATREEWLEMARYSRLDLRRCLILLPLLYDLALAPLAAMLGVRLRTEPLPGTSKGKAEEARRGVVQIEERLDDLANAVGDRLDGVESSVREVRDLFRTTRRRGDSTGDDEYYAVRVPVADYSGAPLPSSYVGGPGSGLIRTKGGFDVVCEGESVGAVDLGGKISFRGKAGSKLAAGLAAGIDAMSIMASKATGRAEAAEAEAAALRGEVSALRAEKSNPVVAVRELASAIKGEISLMREVSEEVASLGRVVGRRDAAS